LAANNKEDYMGIKYVLAKLEDVTSISEGPAEQ
jgi:hypothetical protein